MKRITAEARLNATQEGLDALLSHAPTSDLGRPATRAEDAAAVRRVLRRALASNESIAPVKADSLARMKVVRDFVRRHPEHRPEFSMVFGSNDLGQKRLDEAWAKIQKLQKGQRRRKQ